MTAARATSEAAGASSGAGRDGESRSQSFESAFTRLEETVRQLEDGQLTLDEATALFEEGMRLARRCNELLSKAELRVSRLKTEFAEQMSLVGDEADTGAPSGEAAEEDGV